MIKDKVEEQKIDQLRQRTLKRKATIAEGKAQLLGKLEKNLRTMVGVTKASKNAGDALNVLESGQIGFDDYGNTLQITQVKSEKLPNLIGGKLAFKETTTQRA